jgi:hypothetical protein
MQEQNPEKTVALAVKTGKMSATIIQFFAQLYKPEVDAICYIQVP